MRLHTVVIPALLLFASPMLYAEAANPAPATASSPAKTVAATAARININTADAAALLGLKGVGEKKAQAIVAYRKSKGPFNSLEQFEAVPGIGPSIVAKNKNIIVFR